MKRVAVFGLKGHEGVVFSGMAQLGGFEIVAVADEDERAIARLKRDRPFARQAQGYDDWRMILEHHMIDLALVCDENHRRPDQLVALAEHNVPIVTEKPLATSLAELERVRKAVAESESVLTMLMTMRHEKHMAAVQRLIAEGAIGRPIHADAQKSYRWGNRTGWQQSRERLGGTIPYIGIHAIDLMRWTTGLELTPIAAEHGNVNPERFGETESHAAVLCSLGEEGTATARLDYLRPESAPTHGDDRLRVVGTEGIIETDSLNPKVRLISATDGPQTIEPKPVDNLFVAFWKAHTSGQPLPIPTADCFRITEICLKARDMADGVRGVVSNE